MDRQIWLIGETKQQVEELPSKEKLRKLFPNDSIIIKRITWIRQKIAKGKRGGGGRIKSEKRMQKSKKIWLR
ncbi:MAG TPA: hypothetical protein ENH95_02910 [Nitrosopumilus sp.]|nr:hypothetical protein [Nitrosopumilus sp.]